jgi:predicted nucleotidyltransferase
MKYGLSEKQLDQIINCLLKFPEVEEARLFGSRALETFKEASDVDIAILGEKVDFSLALSIKNELEEETYLPFFFDMVAFNTIDNPSLKEHIEKHSQVIYQRKSESSLQETNPLRRSAGIPR